MPVRNPAPAQIAPRVYAYTASEKEKARRSNPHIRRQGLEIGAWAVDHKIEIAEYVAEYGFDPARHFGQRPEGHRLLDVVRRNDIVVAAKFDRLFGAPEHAHATLTMGRERGVYFRALDLGGGNLNLERSDDLATVLLAVSAAYSDYPKRVAARSVKKQQAEVGRFRGGTKPFGFDVTPDGRLIANPTRQETLAHLLEMRAAGESYRALAAISKQRGFKLTAAGVRKILQRAASEPLDQN